MYEFLKLVRNTLFIIVFWTGSESYAFTELSEPEAVIECPAGTILTPDRLEMNILPLDNLFGPAGNYEERISRIESDAGAFARDLVPELVGLALMQREAGNHLATVKLLQRAFYIVRINDGLYSRNQIPLLEMLIQSHAATEDWKTVADEYDHLYWLYRRNYGPNDAHLLPFIKRLRQWHIDAFDKNTGRPLEVHFRAARELYNKAVSILIACGNDEKVALCFWNSTCCSRDGINEQSCPGDNS